MQQLQQELATARRTVEDNDRQCSRLERQKQAIAKELERQQQSVEAAVGKKRSREEGMPSVDIETMQVNLPRIHLVDVMKVASLCFNGSEPMVAMLNQYIEPMGHPQCPRRNGLMGTPRVDFWRITGTSRINKFSDRAAIVTQW